MRIYFSIIEDGDGEACISKLSSTPFKNCYFADLEDNNLFDLYTGTYHFYNGKLYRYCCIDDYFDGDAEFIAPTLGFDYVETYKEGVKVTSTFDSFLEKALDWYKANNFKCTDVEGFLDEYGVDLSEYA